jgi:hypothetical protein
VSESLPVYSAAQIAFALNRSKRGIIQALENVAPVPKVIRGQQTHAWPIAALPVSLQESLRNAANQKRCRNPETLLQMPCKRWEPPIPLAEIAQSNLDHAAKLQTALRPLLERQHDLSLTEAEFENLGVAEYKKVFAHTISSRHWRRIFNRTIERDLGSEEWSRFDIFLDERPARKQKALSLRAPEEFQALQQAISVFSNPAAPTEKETDYLWLRALDFYGEKIAAGKTSKQAKRLLFPFLEKYAPFLAPTRDALLKAFNRRKEKLEKSGGNVSAIADQRGQKSISISQEDVDKIIAHARLRCGGRVSQAWRELCERGELSEATLSRYLANPKSKSHVPKTIRDLTTNEIRLLENIHHGPRQHKLNGAFISRDWSDVRGGDWWNADDCTLPIYYYVPDGKGWFTLMRGQFLLMIDLRTTQILGFALQSERNYNARVIRTLITRVCDNHHLPRKGFYFENGIWRNSKILKGDSSDAAAMPWGETEVGLQEFGLKFVHAKLPRAKPIERVLGMMQDLMEGDLGYAGRDERHDRYERFQKLKLQFEAKKIHPAGHFYDLDQWENRLHELCEQYNATPEK